MLELPLYSSFLFFLSIFLFSKVSDGNDAFETNCPSYDCGDVKIEYPFWLMSETISNRYCGYPNFNLSCSSSNKTIINLPGDSYYVKEINYTDFTLTLIDVDVTTNQTCPRATHNVTLQTLPFSYNRLNLNLSFYFNCSYLPTSATPIECLSSGEKKSYVFVVGTEPEGIDWYDFCEDKVMVTVIDSEIDQTNGLITGFGGAMNDGFVLNWRTVAECGACEVSDGRCGYNYVTKEFLCFCSNGNIKNDHCKGMWLFF